MGLDSKGEGWGRAGVDTSTEVNSAAVPEGRPFTIWVQAQDPLAKPYSDFMIQQ